MSVESERLLPLVRAKKHRCASALALLILVVMMLCAASARPNIEGSSNFALKEVRRLRIDGYANAVAWNKDGSRLAVLSKFGSHITLLDSSSWSVVNEFDRTSGQYSGNSFAFLADGGLLTAAPGISKYSFHDQAGSQSLLDHVRETMVPSLVEWNPVTGQSLRSLTGTSVAGTFVVSADSKLIAGITLRDVLLFDAHTGQLLRTIHIPSLAALPDTPESVAISPDSHKLVVGSLFGKAHIFRISDGALLHSFSAFSDEYICAALAFSPDGNFLAVTKSRNHNIRVPNEVSTAIWQADGTQPVLSLSGSTEHSNFSGKSEAVPARTLSWSARGSLLAVGDDASLHVWKIDGPHAELVLKRDIAHGAFSVAFSPAGTLAATDNDGVLIYQSP